MPKALFENGYDRRAWNVQEPEYNALNIDARDDKPLKRSAKVPTTSHIDAKLKPKKKTKKSKPELTVSEMAKTIKPVQDPKLISELHDSKNQLSSLIRNAKMNKEALQTRNKRITDSKKKSKSRYGW